MRHNLGISLRHTFDKGISGKDLLCLLIPDLVARAAELG